MADVVALWLEAVESAYRLARGERLGELRGVRIKKYDERGLHPESYLWGAISALQSLEPVLQDEAVSTDPVSLRRAAREDAEAEFRAEILAAAA